MSDVDDGNGPADPTPYPMVGESEAFQQFFEDVSNEIGLSDVDDAMWMLRHLDCRLDAYLNPPKYNPFSRYEKRISEVYLKVMGKPKTVAVPTGYCKNQKTSKFVMVMMTLNQILPDYAQKDYPSPTAWAHALIRARK